MSDEIPDTLVGTLTLRTRKPHGCSRGGFKERIEFSVLEGYRVVREKCMQKFSSVHAILKATNKPLIRLHTDSNIFFKRAKHDPQDRYVRLSQDNFASSIHHRWALHAQSANSSAVLDLKFFLYAENEAKVTLQRATASRVESARAQWSAYDAANRVSFGEITSQHLGVVNARQPDDAPFLVPVDNTTRQAMELDRVRAEMRTLNPRAIPTSAVIKIKIGELWVPIEVELTSLRAALRLPQHDIFSEGIYAKQSDILVTLNVIAPKYD